MEEYLHCLVSPFQVANNQDTNGFALILQYYHFIWSFSPYDDDDGDYILAVRQLESTIFNTSLGLCAAVAGVIAMVFMLIQIVSFGILTVNRWHQLTINTEKSSVLLWMVCCRYQHTKPFKICHNYQSTKLFRICQNYQSTKLFKICQNYQSTKLFKICQNFPHII